jgi:hypothetical protein
MIGGRLSKFSCIHFERKQEQLVTLVSCKSWSSSFKAFSTRQLELLSKVIFSRISQHFLEVTMG